ncbi:OLC1v1008410C1 [Oldenlandia corymbosa var. corymbosa]|uniref:OLC1v1008410C1 n=1 Tax=Oldenlandia corymbosa var. corymbosa TaxID=529605 RepID=A0AAV1DPW5_OLDCO|nr:OLC1v1008410C1 [Oldenlandia corymbosa var. corymbosa]
MVKEWRSRMKKPVGDATGDVVVAKILASRDDYGDEFKMDFLIFVTSSFLHGTNSTKFYYKVIKSLANISEVKEYNWCQFVIKALNDGVDHYQDKGTFYGPMSFLTLCYLDRCRYKESHLRKWSAISCWDEDKMKDKIQRKESKGGFGRVYVEDCVKKPDQEEEQKLQHKKEVIQKRVSPQQLCELIPKLDDKKKGEIMDMGFGALLEIKIKTCPKSLCRILVGRFQFGSGIIQFGNNGQEFIIIEDE